MEIYSLSKNSSPTTFILSIIVHLAILFFLLVYQQYQEYQEHPPRYDNVASQEPQQAQVVFQHLPEPAPTQPQVSAHAIPAYALPQQTVQEDVAPEYVAPQPLPMPAVSPFRDQSMGGVSDSHDAVVASSAYEPPYEPQLVSPLRTKGYPTQSGQSQRKKVSAQAAAALGSLAQGFVKSMQKEQCTKPTIQTTIDDMTRQRYTAKVYKMIHRAVNVRKRMLHLSDNLSTQAVLSITLDKKGVVRDVRIEHPHKTNNLRTIEQELCEATRSAGLYPPVPAIFNVEVLTLRFSINMECNEGFHSYHLSYMGE